MTKVLPKIKLMNGLCIFVLKIRNNIVWYNTITKKIVSYPFVENELK